MLTADRHYTNVGQSDIYSKAERVGDITSKPPTNEDRIAIRNPGW